MGSSSAIARMGSMLAPYIAKSVSKQILIAFIASDQVLVGTLDGAVFTITNISCASTTTESRAKIWYQ